MAKLNEAGLGVYNNYGTRTTDEGRVGDIRTGGIEREMEIDFRGDANAATIVGSLPAGADIQGVYVNVTEAFTGITAIDLGTDGSEATNGVSVPVTVGKATVATGGTWAAVLAAATDIAVVFTGTAAGIGEAKVVIKYIAV